MPTKASRPRALLIATAAAILASSLAVAPAAAHPEPEGLDTFMQAIGHVESGGRYDAVNKASGAYGKYQIMPFNWPNWSKAILGDPKAPQTPENQERVARHRFIHLYHWLGSWPRVAYWWLTGSTKPVEKWSAYARRYVDNVMALAGDKNWQAAARPADAVAGAGTTATPPAPPAILEIGEENPAIGWAGRWSRAQHPGYAGGSVAWSTSKNASATLTFTGRSITWLGPVGPTRGSARVYLDGVLVDTVNQYARSYAPRRTLFTKDFGAAGKHTLRVVVAGTPGHAMVAIDQLVVSQ